MKKFVVLLVSLCLLCALNARDTGQQRLVPQGSIVYSLPQTTIHLSVQARCEQFTAGPYAKYAKKYLGWEAPVENSTRYTLSKIELTPLLEADPHHFYQINLSALRSVDLSMLRITSTGLIVLADTYESAKDKWRFPDPDADIPLSDAGIIENLSDETTTLYRSVVKSGKVEPIPVKQTYMVEKPLEKRAEEAAAMIFALRDKRMNIITGNTDATFSGEAMTAAIEEMRRLEAQYLTLFMGKSTSSTQQLSFDVIPDGSRAKQVYVAFRLSSTEGLLPASDMSGRPIVLELEYETLPGEQPRMQEGDPKVLVLFYYRSPAIMKLSLNDGARLLLQTRMPVYQLGNLLNFPLTHKK